MTKESQNIERSGGIAVELSKDTVKTRVKTQVKISAKTPEAILTALKDDNTLTLAEVAGRIGKSVSAVERAAKKLGGQGKLKYIGPQKRGLRQKMLTGVRRIKPEIVNLYMEE